MVPSTMPMARASSSVRSVSVEDAGRGEVDEVVGPLADDLRVADGAWGSTEDAELTVADLVAVAVRAVQDVAGPPVAQARDVGQLVAQAGRDQQAPCRDLLPVVEQDPELASAVRDRRR